MSDTQGRSTQTIRQEPSGATSITTATAIVIVANWGVKLRYGTEIPADVAAAMGIVLYGAAHLVQLVVLWYLDVRAEPKPVLPPIAVP